MAARRKRPISSQTGGHAEVLEADGRPEVEEVEARALHEDHGVMVHGAGYALEGGFDMAGGQTESLLGVPGSTSGAEFERAAPVGVIEASTPFSEEETRMLIRLRQDMDAQFQGISRKRGLFALYHSLADRLFAAGGGGWPKRSHHTVAQRWNNVVGSYKELLGLRACPSGTKPKTFRYESDMAWFRDQVKPAQVRKLKSSEDDEDGYDSTYPTAWFEFFVYMDGLRAEEGASPDIQDLCIRVCGSLLHPSRRQVLMPIWDSRIQVTPTDLLNRIEVALATIHQRNLQPSVLPSTTSV